MKQGWLVVNRFLQTEKFQEHYRFLQDAAEKLGIALLLKTGAALLNELGGPVASPQGASPCAAAAGSAKGASAGAAIAASAPGGAAFLTAALPRPDFVIFWDKDLRLAAALEKMGLRLYNSARAIALCDDKSLTQLTLAGRLPMPRTVCAPLTYPAVGYSDLSFVKAAGQALGFPMLVKECFGSFGRQVYLAQNLAEAEALAQRLAGRPFLFQEFLASSFGRDVRVQVVGERVIGAMLRQNDSGDFRANITGGAGMRPYVPSAAMEALALSACRLLGLCFAGVDFLFGPAGEPVLCEVNSNAHFKNLYTCTGVNTAEAILRRIAEEIYETGCLP